jgi:hypothetical protein
MRRAPDPPATVGPPRAVATATRRVALAAAGAWVLLALAALAADDPVGAMRSAGGLLLVVAAVALANWPPARRASAPILAVYALGLTAATLLAGSSWIGAGDGGRVQVLTGNPNVLAAALVTAFTAWAAVAPGRRLVWWAWPIVGLAVLHTGSRTAGAALLAAGALWLVVEAVRGRSRLAPAPLLVLAVLAVAAVAWQRGVVELTPNLLAAPSDFADPAWRLDLAEHAVVRAEGAPGPLPGTTAQRLLAQARPGGTFLIHQSIGRSEEGVPYVASIYLRADEPQRVVLTSHLSRVTCEVAPQWNRCVTPVGYGNDRSQRQLHLRAEVRAGSVDVELFGAQYERGVGATPFRDARPAWVPQSMVNRFDLRRITFLPRNRVAPWTAGLAIAREHPYFGAGLEASRSAMLERTSATLSQPVDYAHNLLVQLLAVHGLVGFAGALLITGALLSALPRKGWRRLAPLLVALLLLNTWDVTLLEPAVYPAALLATAYWAGARGER